MREGKFGWGSEAEGTCALFGDGFANSRDQFEPFAPEHHVRRVPAKPCEVSRVGFAPVSKRAVAFTLVMGKGVIYFIEASLRQLDRLDHGSRHALSVEDYHHLADFRRK